MNFEFTHLYACHSNVLSFSQPPAFNINFKAALQKAVNVNLDVNVTFLYLDKRVKLPPEFSAQTKSRTYQLMANRKLKSFSITLDSADNFPDFGVDEDSTVIPKSIQFSVQTHWSLADVDPRSCPEVGCPVMDPRSQKEEKLSREIALETGTGIPILVHPVRIMIIETNGASQLSNRVSTNQEKDDISRQ